MLVVTSSSCYGSWRSRDPRTGGGSGTSCERPILATGAFSAKGYLDLCNIICGLYAIINLEISLLWVWYILNPTAKAGPDQRILGLYTAPGRMSSPLHPQGTTRKACTCWSK